MTFGDLQFFTILLAIAVVAWALSGIVLHGFARIFASAADLSLSTGSRATHWARECAAGPFLATDLSLRAVQ